MEHWNIARNMDVGDKYEKIVNYILDKIIQCCFFFCVRFSQDAENAGDDTDTYIT